MFYLGAAVYVLGTIIYSIFGSGEVQPWAVEKKTPEELQGLDAANQEAAAKDKEMDKKGENMA